LGRVISLNDIPAQLPLHDIVVCCTASPLPIVGKGIVESALTARKHRPMMMFDLAVPRDIELEVGKLDDVFLYTVDDLGKIASAGLAQRQNAVQQAEVIIENQVTDFMHWLDSRELVPTIRALRDSAERARRNEMERALRRLNTGEDPQRVLEGLSQALTNKLMHAPTHALNHASAEERKDLAALLTRLYQIPRQE
jgi:glutamyl-tRNA reductase